MKHKKNIIPQQIFHFWTIVFIFFAICVIGIILSVICQKLTIYPLSEPGDVLNTLWQVQAGVVMLSVSILAIITGFFKDQIYGFRLTEYLKVNYQFRNIQFPINFWDETVVGILFTLLMYIFVIREWVAGAVFLLVGSVLLIVHLLYIVLGVLANNQRTKEQIRHYILQKVDEIVESEQKEEK